MRDQAERPENASEGGIYGYEYSTWFKPTGGTNAIPGFVNVPAPQPITRTGPCFCHFTSRLATG